MEPQHDNPAGNPGGGDFLNRPHEPLLHPILHPLTLAQFYGKHHEAAAAADAREVLDLATRFCREAQVSGLDTQTDAGFDWVIMETVGVGQSEVDIAAACDHTLLVLTPAGGDGVQAFKAGIMEIADVIAVNKSDLAGADRTVRELMAAQGLGAHGPETWLAPIRRTMASKGEGVDKLIDAVLQHRDWLGEAGLQARRERRAEFEVRSLVQERLLRRAREASHDLYARIARGELDADTAADELLRG